MADRITVFLSDATSQVYHGELRAGNGIIEVSFPEPGVSYKPGTVTIGWPLSRVDHYQVEPGDH